MSLSDVLKKGSGAPAPGNLIEGGIGIDTLNKRLYFKAADGSVVPHDLNTPAGTIAAITVQAAINELDTEKASLAANTFTGAQILSDQQLSRAMLVDCGYTFLDKGNSATATQTFDFTAGSHQKVTATGDHTIALSNWPPTGNLGIMVIDYVNAGAFTLTLPTWNWTLANGTTTTSLATLLAQNGTRTALQASGRDRFVVMSEDAGTTVYAALVSI